MEPTEIKIELTLEEILSHIMGNAKLINMTKNDLTINEVTDILNAYRLLENIIEEHYL